MLLEGENQKDSASSALAASADVPYDFKHRRSSSKSSKWNEELSPSGSTITESTQAGELISGSKLPTVCCAKSFFYFVVLLYVAHEAYFSLFVHLFSLLALFCMYEGPWIHAISFCPGKICVTSFILAGVRLKYERPVCSFWFLFG